ncbi:MAG: hypothetical protein DRI98_12790 [Bacteroidetes bacterium]|nr:MAG: hypothetical protein DRI98_12790 [Bacteroidota bacterium]
MERTQGFFLFRRIGKDASLVFIGIDDKTAVFSLLENIVIPLFIADCRCVLLGQGQKPHYGFKLLLIHVDLKAGTAVRRFFAHRGPAAMPDGHQGRYIDPNAINDDPLADILA